METDPILFFGLGCVIGGILTYILSNLKKHSKKEPPIIEQVSTLERKLELVDIEKEAITRNVLLANDGCVFCPKCGKETDNSGKFCQWCGASLYGDKPTSKKASSVGYIYCPKCGKETPNDGMFCAWCGSNIPGITRR